MDRARTRVDEHIFPQRLAALLPNFLIISPPKTGSTWLAANLNFHPELFIPEVKEIHYFSRHIGQKSWDWYAECFRPGLGLVKGEASPDYCLLSPDVVRLMHSLMPRLKLIYLMREPIGQAWSHARHCLRHRLMNFEGCRLPPEQVPDDKWLENFGEPGSRRSFQVLDHLRLWTSWFPKEQIYIDFYNSIRDQPDRLLQRIFAFLGVNRLDDFAEFPLREKLNEGTPCPLSPRLREWLRARFAPEARSLAEYLRTEFHLELPAAWRPLLLDEGNQPTDCVAPLPPPVQAVVRASSVSSAVPALPRRGLKFGDFEKARLIVKHTPRPRVHDYFGYRITHYLDRYFAVDRLLGGIELNRLRPRQFRKLSMKGLLFASAALEGVKLKVVLHELARAGCVPDKTPAAACPRNGSTRDAPRTRDADFLGYRLLYHRGVFHGVAHSVGPFDPRRLTEGDLARMESERLLHRSLSLDHVQLRIAEARLKPVYLGPRRYSIVIRAPRFLLRRVRAYVEDFFARRAA